MKIDKQFAEKVIDTYLERIEQNREILSNHWYSDYILSKLVHSYKQKFIDHLQQEYEYCLTQEGGEQFVCECFQKGFRQATVLPTLQDRETRLGGASLDMFVWYALHDSNLFFNCINAELRR